MLQKLTTFALLTSSNHRNDTAFNLTHELGERARLPFTRIPTEVTNYRILSSATSNQLFDLSRNSSLSSRKTGAGNTSLEEKRCI